MRRRSLGLAQRALSSAAASPAAASEAPSRVAAAAAARELEAPSSAASSDPTFASLARRFVAVVSASAALAAASAAATATRCDPAPVPEVRRAVLAAWEHVDADLHREEAASLSTLSPFAGGSPLSSAFSSLVFPPAAPPPRVDVDDSKGSATVSFSLREGADGVAVLLALAEALQELARSPTSSSPAPLSVSPLLRGRGGRGLRLSAGGSEEVASATFVVPGAASSSTPEVELTAPAASFVSSGGPSPLEPLFRASNSVLTTTSDESGEGTEVGEERPRQKRRSFSRTWTWSSDGGSSSSSPRGDVVGPLFESVDEAFRQSLEELFGPLERDDEESEGGGVRLRREERRRLGRPAAPSPGSPSTSSSPSPPPRPPAVLPRGGSARAASAIAALEDLGCSVFLPPTASAETGRDGDEARERPPSSDPWAGLAAYGPQKEQVRLALLPLTHGEVVSGVARAARKKGSSDDGGGASSALPSAPRAVLFEGPPGCGKTSSARAAARLAGAPLVVAPLESIVSKWYGEAEQRLASVFKHCRELAAARASLPSSSSPSSSPSSAGVLLFVDEVDALATSRGDGGMHEATRRVLGTLLRELDGLRAGSGSDAGEGGKGDGRWGPSSSTGNVVAVLSTNRPGDIDAALASRCAARVFFPLPSAEDRAAILALHARHLTTSQLSELSRKSEGLSPRDLVDATAAAERAWASAVVAGDAEPATPPPFEEYERAVGERAARRW